VRLIVSIATSQFMPRHHRNQECREGLTGWKRSAMPMLAAWIENVLVQSGRTEQQFRYGKSAGIQPTDTFQFGSSIGSPGYFSGSAKTKRALLAARGLRSSGSSSCGESSDQVDPVSVEPTSKATYCLPPTA